MYELGKRDGDAARRRRSAGSSDPWLLAVEALAGEPEAGAALDPRGEASRAVAARWGRPIPQRHPWLQAWMRELPRSLGPSCDPRTRSGQLVVGATALGAVAMPLLPPAAGAVIAGLVLTPVVGSACSWPLHRSEALVEAWPLSLTVWMALAALPVLAGTLGGACLLVIPVLCALALLAAVALRLRTEARAFWPLGMRPTRSEAEALFAGTVLVSSVQALGVTLWHLGAIGRGLGLIVVAFAALTLGALAEVLARWTQARLRERLAARAPESGGYGVAAGGHLALPAQAAPASVEGPSGRAEPVRPSRRADAPAPLEPSGAPERPQT